MSGTDFNDLMWFRIVAEERSFTRAAARIGVAQSTLSHTIKRLETNLGLRLLNRTTRNVATTPAGERLLATVALRRDWTRSRTKLQRCWPCVKSRPDQSV